jgi:hypothetical protein
MMQASDHRHLDDSTLVGPLHRSRLRCVLLQGKVSPAMVVVGEVVSQQVTQVRVVEDHEVSGAGEFHPHALSEPYVSLSTHTAPINQPSVSNGFAPLIGSSCCQLADGQCWLTCPLRSTGFRRLPRYYEALCPCAPPRYVPSWKVRSLEGFPLHRDDRFPRSAEEPESG